MSDIETKVAELEAKEKEIEQANTLLESKKAEIADYDSKKEALNSELKRVQADIAAAKEERRAKESSFQEKLRNENLDVAKAKFFSKFDYKQEDQAKFLEIFKTFDSQAVSPDLIYRDMMKAHVASNPEKYVEFEEKIKHFSKNADEFAAASSSSAFAGGGFEAKTELEGLDQNDILAAQRAGISIEKYREYKIKYGW